MNTSTKIINEGLKPLPHDERDFSLGALYKLAPLDEFSHYNFHVAEPLKLKDQMETDFCTAYAVTEVSEDQEGIELSPEFQFAMTKMLQGNPDEWGADLRTAMKVPVKIGSMPQDYVDRYLEAMKIAKDDRAKIVDMNTWPDSLIEKASPHKKQTYFKVDGPYDLFDNIRASLWTHRAEKCTVTVGALWRSDWTYAAGGIIPKEYSGEGFGHAFKLYGQAIIYDEPYLIAQLSNGDSIGDHGIFYFPRSVVNKEFAKFGAFMFKDLPRETAEKCLAIGAQACDNWFVKLWKWITSNFFNI